MQPHPPFRADHIGSLLRPAGLRLAPFTPASWTRTALPLRRMRRSRDAIRLQQEVGLPVVTDGEISPRLRIGAASSKALRVSMWPRRALSFTTSMAMSLLLPPRMVTAKLARRRPDWARRVHFFMREHATALPKVTLPAPSTMHFWRGAAYAVPGLYGSPRDFFRDLAAIYRAEIADSPCRRWLPLNIQLDEVALAMLCDPAVRSKVAADGNDPARLVALYVEAISGAVAAAPPDMAVGVHMCRGNFKRQIFGRRRL